MDFYAILGLERDATDGEIRRAYRRLTRRYHPDLNPGDRAAGPLYQQVVEAFETLTDPARRQRYDAGLHPGEPGDPSPSFEFAGFDFTHQVDASEGPTFGELFAEVIRSAAAGAPGPERGADLHGRVSIGFTEAMQGAEPVIRVTRLTSCTACQGRGSVRMVETVCEACGGGGAVRSVRGHMVFSKPCDVCGGAGRLLARACHMCGGEGVRATSETIAIPIPAGVTDGARITVPGAGHAGRRGGAAGNHSNTVAVWPHPSWRREGDDVLMEVPVAIHEAGLGARIEIETPTGPTTLRVPAGTQSGQRFRLRGRGAPRGRGDERGDLIVDVRVVLPAVLDERSKELLREFGRINPENVRRDPTTGG